MKISALTYLFSISLFFLSLVSCKNETILVLSPDSKTRIEVMLEGDKLYHEVKQDGKSILNKSELGFTFSDEILGQDIQFSNIDHICSNIETSLACTVIDSLYNQMVVSVEEKGNLKRKFDIVFRVYNNAYAFRYEFPIQNNLKDFSILAENTKFNFPKNYKPTPHTVDTTCYSMAIPTGDGSFLTINKEKSANPSSIDMPKTISSTLGLIDEETVFMKTPSITPWRIVFLPKAIS